MDEAALNALGWGPSLAAAFRAHAAAGLFPGRVCREHRGAYRVLTAAGECGADLAGRLRHGAASPAELPAVGDWVALRARAAAGRAVHPVVEAVLPRHSRFLRKAVGRRRGEQVVAANVDTVFVVAGLDGESNPRRLERYLVTARESGARPVVVLNKADLSEDAAAAGREVERLAAGAPVLAVSARTGEGLERLDAYLGPGQTVVFLGSSGVGKSSLVNALLGQERLRTGEVRSSDGRGRHITSHREMLRLPGGALAIDTPGLRELALWAVDAGLGLTFDDVETLAAGCQFRDCRHGHEPGCAVREALAEGRLGEERLASFLKLRDEAARARRQREVEARARERGRPRSAHRLTRRPRS